MDRVGKSESYQIMHWILDQDRSLNSKWSDPLTRQLSEAVRIELRGEEILKRKKQVLEMVQVSKKLFQKEGWKTQNWRI
jgi:hypothetical protein